MAERITEQGDAAIPDDRKPILYKNGKIYFTHEGERRFYFILTLGMVVWGICVKLGVW